MYCTSKTYPLKHRNGVLLSLNRKKVFVTGAGTINWKSVCNHFLEKNYIVLGLTRQKQKGLSRRCD